MKLKKKVVFGAYSVLLLAFSIVNFKQNYIIIPSSEEMISRQIDYITISTVFTGFSFTALGLLLGLSSEKLIEKIKNTNIIMNKVARIIYSIVFFILSVAVSLIFVLGLDRSLVGSVKVLAFVDSILYTLSVGYLIGGIGFFVYSIYELYDLVRRVYGYNKKESNKNIATARDELEATRKKMRQIEQNNFLE